MSEEGKPFDRAAKREPWTKPFAIQGSHLTGRTNKQTFDKYPEYRKANEMFEACLDSAHAYATTMILRVNAEEPDFLVDRGMTQEEFVAHMSNNYCLGFSKYRSHVVKESIADVHENGYLQDRIRRLVNHGDKFHPYL